YTGQEYDVESGFNYMNARYYDPHSGRFINQDPIGFKGGSDNLYEYVGNNSINDTDPTGTKSFWKRLWDDWLGNDDSKVFGINKHTWLGGILNLGVTALSSAEMLWNWDDYWDRMDEAAIRVATDPLAGLGIHGSFGIDLGFVNFGAAYDGHSR